MPEKFYLQQFYTVTLTSLYDVKAHFSEEDRAPSATKILVAGESTVKVGEVLVTGTMLAITTRLQVYFPEGDGLIRGIEMTSPRNWGGYTSEIVALFTSLQKAVECLRTASLVPRDPRWMEETKRVLKMITEDHPTFYVCRQEGMTLLVP